MSQDYPSAVWPEGEHLLLMRAALLDGPSAAAAFREWSGSVAFDDLDQSSFRLLPLLRWNMHRLGVKHPLMPRLDSVCRFLLVETTMKLDALRRLALALHEMNVPRLLLKGSALGQTYYPNPSLRPMADCDLLIPGETHETALAKLFAAGWRTVGDEAAVRHYSADLWHPPFQTIHVELHWRSGIQSTLRDDRMTWDAAEDLEFRGVPCRVFCAEDEIIHACRHGFNWTPEAPPMRWLADCAMIVRHAGARLDWDRLARRARALEETLCVLDSLEWLRRENCAPVPAEALQKLRAQGVRRRERSTYALKAKPRDWGVTSLLYARFLHRELPCWLWPLHWRRVLRYFAGQFALPDHADTPRYFIYHFRRAARRRNPRLEALLAKMAKASGMRRISTTWLGGDFTGMLEEPSELCWGRRKLSLYGFAYANDGSAMGPIRVTHRGSVIHSIRHESPRIDIAKGRPGVSNALRSGFSILVDIPGDECELVVEHRGARGWGPLFAVQIGNFQIVEGNVLPLEFPVLEGRIDFGTHDCEKYLVGGWSPPEGAARWSDGSRAGIMFGLAETGDLDLEATMRPYLRRKGRGAQTVHVYLNRRKICTWKLTDESPVIRTARLPKEFLEKNNLLIFHLPQAASPAARGGSTDKRKLAIQMEWMKLDAPGTRAASQREQTAGGAQSFKPSKMGAIHFSIDAGMVRALQAGVPMETFVETGTFHGAGVEAARPLFKKIFTVELSPELHRAAVEKFQADATVEVLQGNSPAVLASLRPRLEKESVLYWLDAHWCAAEGDATAGAESQCPLLHELDAIGALNEKSAILIDDARLFLSAPPAPHEAADWPDFDSIARKLYSLAPCHALAVVNDVIACVPRAALPALREFARNHSPDLLVELGKAKLYDALKKDRDELAANVDKLSVELKKSETDRTERLRAIEELDRILKETSGRLAESEADRAERLNLLNETSARLTESEADRAERLRAIERLDQMLRETSERLAISEADRAARLEVIERQDKLLKEQAARAGEQQN